jgi:hypothetical protein
MMMDAPRESGSAKIYQFPVRGRFAAAERSTATQAAMPLRRVVCGEAWYHEEAIQEAERAGRK